MSDMSEIRSIVSQGIVVSFPDAELAYRRERLTGGHVQQTTRSQHHLRTVYRRVRGITHQNAADLG
jgi:hypothetical protein